MNTLIGFLTGGALVAAACYLRRLSCQRSAKPGVLRYCPQCWSHLQTMSVAGRQRTACPSCAWVHWDNPKPVTATLINVDGGIVLVKRKFPPFPGSWCLPCGFMEGYELPEEAAMRETAEETGLTVKIHQLLEVVKPPRAVNEIIILYLATPVDGTLTPGDDALEARVFTKDTLPDNIPFTTHRRIIDEWFAGSLVGVPVRGST